MSGAEDHGREAPLLRVRGLRVEVATPRGPRRLLHDVSLDLGQGEGGALALVGASGSGKSTLARALLRLVPVAAGSIWCAGLDVLTARGAALREHRRRVQMIFQDPGGSLDPRFTVLESVAEPMVVHGTASSTRTAAGRVGALLERCGLSAAFMARRPHELSGGERQRAAIARALACGPRLLVCDEPTSALDVSGQATVLNLLGELWAEGLAVLLITHDLAVADHLCPRVAVMDGGEIVEQGPRERLWREPAHGATRALVSAARAMERAATLTRP